MHGVKLHWFWRAAIAVIVAGACGAIWNSDLLRFVHSVVGYPVAYGIQLPLMETGLPAWLTRGLAIGVWGLLIVYPPVALAAVVVYHLLTRRYGPTTSPAETRCRKCGYILRGITEPRCPECGERI